MSNRFGFYSICPCCSIGGPFDFYGKVFKDINMTLGEESFGLPQYREPSTYFCRFASVFPSIEPLYHPPSQWSSAHVPYKSNASYIQYKKILNKNYKFLGGIYSSSIGFPVTNLSSIYSHVEAGSSNDRERVWNIRRLFSPIFASPNRILNANFTTNVSSGFKYENNILETTGTGYLTNITGGILLNYSWVCSSPTCTGRYLFHFAAEAKDVQYLKLNIKESGYYYDEQEAAFGNPIQSFSRTRSVPIDLINKRFLSTDQQSKEQFPGYYPLVVQEGQEGTVSKYPEFFLDYTTVSGKDIVYCIYAPLIPMSIHSNISICPVDQFGGSVLNANTGLKINIYDINYSINTNDGTYSINEDGSFNIPDFDTFDIALIEESESDPNLRIKALVPMNNKNFEYLVRQTNFWLPTNLWNTALSTQEGPQVVCYPNYSTTNLLINEGRYRPFPRYVAPWYGFNNLYLFDSNSPTNWIIKNVMSDRTPFSITDNGYAIGPNKMSFFRNLGTPSFNTGLLHKNGFSLINDFDSDGWSEFGFDFVGEFFDEDGNVKENYQDENGNLPDILYSGMSARKQTEIGALTYPQQYLDINILFSEDQQLYSFDLVDNSGNITGTGYLPFEDKLYISTGNDHMFHTDYFTLENPCLASRFHQVEDEFSGPYKLERYNDGDYSDILYHDPEFASGFSYVCSSAPDHYVCSDGAIKRGLYQTTEARFNLENNAPIIPRYVVKPRYDADYIFSEKIDRYPVFFEAGLYPQRSFEEKDEEWYEDVWIPGNPNCPDKKPGNAVYVIDGTYYLDEYVDPTLSNASYKQKMKTISFDYAIYYGKYGLKRFKYQDGNRYYNIGYPSFQAADSDTSSNFLLYGLAATNYYKILLPFPPDSEASSHNLSEYGSDQSKVFFKATVTADLPYEVKGITNPIGESLVYNENGPMGASNLEVFDKVFRPLGLGFPGVGVPDNGFVTRNDTKKPLAYGDVIWADGKIDDSRQTNNHYAAAIFHVATARNITYNAQRTTLLSEYPQFVCEGDFELVAQGDPRGLGYECRTTEQFYQMGFLAVDIPVSQTVERLNNSSEDDIIFPTFSTFSATDTSDITKIRPLNPTTLCASWAYPGIDNNPCNTQPDYQALEDFWQQYLGAANNEIKDMIANRDLKTNTPQPQPFAQSIGDRITTVDFDYQHELIVKIHNTVLERLTITKQNEAFYQRDRFPTDENPDPKNLKTDGVQIDDNDLDSPAWPYSESFNMRFCGLSAIKRSPYVPSTGIVDFVYFKRIWSNKNELPIDDHRPYVGEPTGKYGDPIGWDMIAVNRNGDVVWTLPDNRGGLEHYGTWSGIWNSKLHHPDVFSSSEEFIYVHGFWRNDSGFRLEGSSCEPTIECGAWRIAHDLSSITPLRVVKQGEHNDKRHGIFSDFAFMNEDDIDYLTVGAYDPDYIRGEHFSDPGLAVTEQYHSNNLYDSVKFPRLISNSPDVSLDKSTEEAPSEAPEPPNDIYDLVVSKSFSGSLPSPFEGLENCGGNCPDGILNGSGYLLSIGTISNPNNFNPYLIDLENEYGLTYPYPFYNSSPNPNRKYKLLSAQWVYGTGTGIFDNNNIVGTIQDNGGDFIYSAGQTSYCSGNCAFSFDYTRVSTDETLEEDFNRPFVLAGNNLSFLHQNNASFIKFKVTLSGCFSSKEYYSNPITGQNYTCWNFITNCN